MKDLKDYINEHAEMLVEGGEGSLGKGKKIALEAINTFAKNAPKEIDKLYDKCMKDDDPVKCWNIQVLHSLIDVFNESCEPVRKKKIK